MAHRGGTAVLRRCRDAVRHPRASPGREGLGRSPRRRHRVERRHRTIDGPGRRPPAAHRRTRRRMRGLGRDQEDRRVLRLPPPFLRRAYRQRGRIGAGVRAVRERRSHELHVLARRIRIQRLHPLRRPLLPARTRRTGAVHHPPNGIRRGVGGARRHRKTTSPGNTPLPVPLEHQLDRGTTRSGVSFT